MNFEGIEPEFQEKMGHVIRVFSEIDCEEGVECFKKWKKSEEVLVGN